MTSLEASEATEILPIADPYMDQAVERFTFNEFGWPGFFLGETQIFDDIDVTAITDRVKAEARVGTLRKRAETICFEESMRGIGDQLQAIAVVSQIQAPYLPGEKFYSDFLEMTGTVTKFGDAENGSWMLLRPKRNEPILFIRIDPDKTVHVTPWSDLKNAAQAELPVLGNEYYANVARAQLHQDAIFIQKAHEAPYSEYEKIAQQFLELDFDRINIDQNCMWLMLVRRLDYLQPAKFVSNLRDAKVGERGSFANYLQALAYSHALPDADKARYKKAHLVYENLQLKRNEINENWPSAPAGSRISQEEWDMLYLNNAPYYMKAITRDAVLGDSNLQAGVERMTRFLSSFGVTDIEELGLASAYEDAGAPTTRDRWRKPRVDSRDVVAAQVGLTLFIAIKKGLINPYDPFFQLSMEKMFPGISSSLYDRIAIAAVRK